MSPPPVDLAGALFDPRAIVVIGASDNPQKIGGRPLLYLRRFGYRGTVYAVNPHRQLVQGFPAFPSLASVPETPDLAVIVTPGDRVADAVDACAARGVRAAIVMSSGFSETQAPGAIALERSLVERARAGQMRIVGPNTQGLASFHTGVVASFSTMFFEMKPADGPVAIVSQSGIMSAVPLGLLQRARIGVRYSLATGNEADVSAPELAIAALEDPAIRLLLLYFESIRDPGQFAAAAALAHARDVPIVAVKAGRSSRGQQAAASHTAALASDSRIVDAFFRRHGIWRAHDIHELVRTAPLYLRGWRPTSRSLVIVSNSGASCVMAADTAEDLGMPVAAFDGQTMDALRRVTPAFAAVANPIDVTAELMHDSSLLGRVLDVIADRPRGDLMAIDLPVSGEGYDLERLATDSARFADRVAQPVIVSTPQAATAAAFLDAGLPVFDNPTEALKALAQLVEHTALMRSVSPKLVSPEPAKRAKAEAEADLPVARLAEARLAEAREASGGEGGFLNEAESLARLGERGLPIVEYRVCHDEAAVRAAFHALGPRVAIKACSRDVPHKARLGLVSLNVASEQDAAGLFQAFRAALHARHARVDGVLVQRMTAGRRELAIGAIRDPLFGPLVMISGGGTAIESLGDAVFLLTPVRDADVHDALSRLRRGLRAGQDGIDAAAIDAVCRIAIGTGQLIVEDPSIASVDINPVLVGADGRGAVIVDALIEVRTAVRNAEPSENAESHF